jgi:hypothetical protein
MDISLILISDEKHIKEDINKIFAMNKISFKNFNVNIFSIHLKFLIKDKFKQNFW